MLNEWLKANGHNQSWLASMLGISETAVSKWCRTEPTARPSAHHRVAIERITGIPADSWMTTAERRVAYGEDGGEK